MSQVRTATAELVRLWTGGYRCTQARAASIASRIRRTQARNATAAGRHREKTLARLHAAGIVLTAMRTCVWRK